MCTMLREYFAVILKLTSILFLTGVNSFHISKISFPLINFVRPISTEVSHAEPEHACIVFLPGMAVPPALYKPLLAEIHSYLQAKGVTSETHLVHFSVNAGHRLETHLVRNYIDKELKHSKVFLMGHSMGAFTATHVAQQLETPLAGLVQLAGHWNSRGGLPYERMSLNTSFPFLTLLHGNDARLPVTEAILDLKDFSLNAENPEHAFIVVPHLEHFSGVQPGTSHILRRIKRFWDDAELSDEKTDELAVAIIAHRVSSFADYVLQGSKRSKDDLVTSVENTIDRYSPFVDSKDRYSTQSEATKLQAMVYNSDPHYIVDSRVASNLYAAVVQAAFNSDYPWPFDWIALLKFIFSHTGSWDSVGSQSNTVRTVLYVPWVSAVAATARSEQLASAPLWVKFDTDPDRACNVSGKSLNEHTFQTALAEVTASQRVNYERHGRKLVFGNDITLPLVPFCSVVWLAMGLCMESAGDEMIVRSPVLKTKPGRGEYDSKFNAKLLSKGQALEWIICKSFS